ncbi:phage tail tube protein [Paenibacillus taichungensis]|uniref:phage tail tube protein n=1 Tax=Paenibacillus taichungensis TaxID=484184 RepID=UPI002DBEF2B0|nr:phage tail tube protein [Paenibacillus taichungensis]MEC0107270.1 phage tail tube protein [Paenibacillus taichungensis]MEC0194798.1 phage tail tube protein [Paenibacillus taichungensis]
MDNKGNKVVSGSNLTTWLNSEILDDIKKMEYKVTGEFEDVTFLDDPRTYKKYVGYNGEGTLTFNKTQSRGAKLLAEAYTTGVMPEIKIVTKAFNPSTGRSERCVLTGVTFTEFGGSYEAKALVEEELPFSFAKFEFVEYM